MPRRKNPDSELNIRRIDTKPGKPHQTHGFQVHYKRGDTSWTKLFSDAAYADKEAARAAARNFREYLPTVIPESKAGEMFWPGSTGYSFREQFNKDGSKTYYISASARIYKGKAVNRQFRIIGNDIDSAIKQALDWRKSIIKARMSATTTDG